MSKPILLATKCPQCEMPLFKRGKDIICGNNVSAMGKNRCNYVEKDAYADDDQIHIDPSISNQVSLKD